VARAAAVTGILCARGARADGLLDPRSLGSPAGHFGLLVGVGVGVAGIAATAWLGRIRRYHSRRWVRPWLMASVAAVPLLLAGLPLAAGAIASRYLWGSHFADQAVLASTRFMAVAAGAVWLVFEFLAADRQHQQDLYAAQRAPGAASGVMRAAAAVLGLCAVVALLQGLAVAVLK